MSKSKGKKNQEEIKLNHQLQILQNYIGQGTREQLDRILKRSNSNNRMSEKKKSQKDITQNKSQVGVIKDEFYIPQPNPSFQKIEQNNMNNFSQTSQNFNQNQQKNQEQVQEENDDLDSNFQDSQDKIIQNQNLSINENQNVVLVQQNFLIAESPQKEDKQEKVDLKKKPGALKFQRINSLLNNKRRSTQSQDQISSLIKQLVQTNKDKTNEENMNQKDKKKVFKDLISRVDRLKYESKYEIVYPFLIIPCESRLKYYFDTFIMIFIFYIATVVPFELAFNIQLVKIIDYMIVAIFILDILISLRTTFYNNLKDEIINQKDCALHYIKSLNFIVDLLSSIPITEFSAQSEQNPTLRLLNLVKILRLLRLQKILRKLSDSHIRVIGQIIVIFISFILLIHWVTCCWIFIIRSEFPNVEIVQTQAWYPPSLRLIYQDSLDENLIQIFYNHYDFISFYLLTYYAIIMLMLGGETMPTNQFSAQFFVGVVISGQIALALVFGKLSLLLFELVQNSIIYEKHYTNIMFFVKLNNLKTDLKNRIFEYFEYCWKHKKIYQPEYRDFNGLSKTLKKECLLVIHRDSVAKVELFQFLDVQELLWIIQNLKTMVFLPNEFINQKGEIDNKLYFITEGLIEENDSDYKDIYENSTQIKSMNEMKIKTDLSKKKSISKLLQKGDWFGEMNLVYNVESKLNRISNIFVTVESLSKQDFMKLQSIFLSINHRINKGVQQLLTKNFEEIKQIISQSTYFINWQQEEIEELVNQNSGQFFLQPKEILQEKIPFLNQNKNCLILVLNGQISSIIQKQNEEDQFICLDDYVNNINRENLLHIPSEDKFYQILKEYKNQQFFSIDEYSSSKEIQHISIKQSIIVLFKTNNQNKQKLSQVIIQLSQENQNFNFDQITQISEEISQEEHSKQELRKQLKKMEKILQDQKIQIQRLDKLLDE